MHLKCVLLVSLGSLARIAMETDPRPVFSKLAAMRLGVFKPQKISIKGFFLRQEMVFFDTVVKHVNISTLRF